VGEIFSRHTEDERQRRSESSCRHRQTLADLPAGCIASLHGEDFLLPDMQPFTALTRLELNITVINGAVPWQLLGSMRRL